MGICDPTEVLAAGVDCNRGVWIGLGVTLFIGLCALFTYLGCYWERLLARVRKRARRWAQGDSPDCSEVAVERSGEDPPLLLRVSSPQNQVLCSGDYELVPDKRPAGMPLWRKRGGDRWLYTGDDGRWYIGGPSSEDRHFACSSGFIYHNRVHEGILPHSLAGPWEWGGGTAWHKDPAISIVAAPVGARGHRSAPESPTDERSGALGSIPDGSALTFDLPSPRSRGRAGSRIGKKDNPSEVSTDDGAGQQSSAPESSDASSSTNYRVAHNDGLPPPVACRPQSSPWRSPGRLVQILDEPGAERHARSQSEPPRVLCITSPVGQKDCAGEYMLVERMRANGQSVWRQQNGEHWLYSGTTGRWCIGGQDVKDEDFARSAGFISQTSAHNGAMPDSASWQRWDAGQGKFVKDDQISAVARPQLDLGILV